MLSGINGVIGVLAVAVGLAMVCIAVTLMWIYPYTAPFALGVVYLTMVRPIRRRMRVITKQASNPDLYRTAVFPPKDETPHIEHHDFTEPITLGGHIRHHGHR